MESIGLVVAKGRFSELVERAAGGERIQITKRGVPVAELGPVRAGPKRTAREAVEHIRQMRRGNRLGGISIRELIEDGRT